LVGNDVRRGVRQGGEKGLGGDVQREGGLFQWEKSKGLNKIPKEIPVHQWLRGGKRGTKNLKPLGKKKKKKAQKGLFSKTYNGVWCDWVRG